MSPARLPLIALLLLALSNPALAGPPPELPPGWWAKLEGGEQLVYKVHGGKHTVRRRITVQRVVREGALLTVVVERLIGDQPSGRKTTTFAAARSAGPESWSDRSWSWEKLRDEPLELAETKWPCTVYRVSKGQRSLEVWRCPALPPVFGRGVVKVVEGGRTVLELASYKGPRLDRAP